MSRNILNVGMKASLARILSSASLYEQRYSATPGLAGLKGQILAVEQSRCLFVAIDACHLEINAAKRARWSGSAISCDQTEPSSPNC